MIKTESHDLEARPFDGGNEVVLTIQDAVTEEVTTVYLSPSQAHALATALIEAIAASGEREAEDDAAWRALIADVRSGKRRGVIVAGK